jgi:hypothetical protein
MTASTATASFWRSRVLAALFVAAQLAGCGGGGGGGSTAPTPSPAPAPASAPAATQAQLPANAVQVTVDRGVDGTAFNSPFVSVTVCAPGTSTCQTIDHVLVDTGSYGLRLAASVLDPSLALPAVTNAGGAPVGECAHFVDGFAWGAVRRADVKLASETATALPVQVVGDTGAPYASVPPACSNSGSNFGNGLGANGILGVGLFAPDCPSCVASAAPSVYFACGTSGCTSTAMPLTSQVTNPVAAFPQDNNGVILTLPPVPTGGVSTLTGSLVFGIGSQSNNQITNQTVFTTDSRGNMRTTYKGATLSSFLDSGSNALFFTDSSIAQCSGFYCPGTPLTLSAVNTSTTGVSQSVTFTIQSITSVASNASAANVGADGGLGNSFDWGLPFFFGRSVYVAFAGAVTPKGLGPYWAW